MSALVKITATAETEREAWEQVCTKLLRVSRQVSWSDSDVAAQRVLGWLRRGVPEGERRG